MKKHITVPFKILAFAFVFILSISKTFASEDDFSVEKRKTYNKTYPLDADQKVSIKNSFGSVVINNYKGSEVKVEVTVIARANSADRAQSILDNITINDVRASTISFQTKIDNNKNNRGQRNESQGMEVNYVVYLPESNPLEVTNEFGKTELPDRSGLTDVTSKFGEAVVGALTNVGEIKIEFGSLTADKLKGGKTVFKYSDIKVKSFSGAVKSSFEFCGKAKLGISNDVTDINISNSYSDIDLDFPAAFNGTYDIHTSFGDFDNRTAFKINDVDAGEEEHGPKFDNDYAGQSGNGAIKVKIKSSFGKIKFS